MVLKGEPPENIGKEELIQYLRGLEKLAKRVEKFNREKSTWISQYGDQRGFEVDQRVKQLDESLAGVPQEAYALLDDQDPQSYVDFEEYYGFDPRQYRAELVQQKELLKSITGK